MPAEELKERPAKLENALTEIDMARLHLIEEILLSDNGGSYVSAELGEWLSDRGVA